MADPTKKPNRLIVKEAVEAGDATRESLKTNLDLPPSSLATAFSQLRLMGHYVKEKADGTLCFITEEEWEIFKAQRAENAKSRKQAPRNPQQTYDGLVKRIKRTHKDFEDTQERAKAKDTELFDLRADKAEICFKIASLEFQDFLDRDTSDIDFEFITVDEIIS